MSICARLSSRYPIVPHLENVSYVLRSVVPGTILVRVPVRMYVSRLVSLTTPNLITCMPSQKMRPIFHDDVNQNI